MKKTVDLSELAVERTPTTAASTSGRVPWLTRYLLPALLLAGFVAIVAWSARDAFLPRHPVTVVPVLVSHAEQMSAGTPLFPASGWVEPRPTLTRIAALTSGVVDRLLVVEDQLVTRGEPGIVNLLAQISPASSQANVIQQLAAIGLLASDPLNLDGQPVAYLIKDDARYALQSARAALQLRRAEVDQARTDVHAAETNLKYPVHLEAAASEALFQLAKVETELIKLPFNLASARASLRVAEEDLKGKLASGSLIAGVQLDRARSERDSAQAMVDELARRAHSLEQERDALKNRHAALSKRLELKTDEVQAMGQAVAQLKAAEARVEQARVAVAEAELRFDRMTVRTPVTGRIHQLIAAPGAHVATGAGHSMKKDSATVVTLYQPDRLQVRVDVRFQDLPRVTRGQPALIECPALPGPISGTVLFLSPLADIQKNTLEVKVAIDSAPAVLKPEMLVDVTFLAPPPKKQAKTSEERLRLLVPKQLVANDDNGTFVWIADQATGMARRQRIKTGKFQSGAFVEVVEGLTPASRLIVQGREALADGTRIEVREDPSLGVDAPGVTSD